jgi:palmitoyltransferase ZDHHC9/14/18
LISDKSCIPRPVLESEEVVLRPTELMKSPAVGIDLSELDLDLDEVTNSVVPLSASRLRLLQDTTMIESALDLDSLEESTSSIDTGSQAGLLKPKDVL